MDIESFYLGQTSFNARKCHKTIMVYVNVYNFFSTLYNKQTYTLPISFTFSDFNIMYKHLAIGL